MNDRPPALHGARPSAAGPAKTSPRLPLREKITKKQFPIAPEMALLKRAPTRFFPPVPPGGGPSLQVRTGMAAEALLRGFAHGRRSPRESRAPCPWPLVSNFPWGDFSRVFPRQGSSPYGKVFSRLSRNGRSPWPGRKPEVEKGGGQPGDRRLLAVQIVHLGSLRKNFPGPDAGPPICSNRG